MSNEIINVNSTTGEIVGEDYMTEQDFKLVFCSLDMSDPETMISIVNGFAGALSLNDEIGPKDVIEVKGVYVTPGIRKSRDPRVPDAPCLNTYIVAGDETYFTQSSGIARSVQLMSTIPGFFDTPRKMQVVSNKTGSGNTIKSLKVLK